MNTNSRTKSTLFNFFTGFGGQIVQVLLKFVTRTVFISVLGPAYLGINGLFSDILTLLSITELGFDTAINYKLYKPLAEKNVERLRSLIRFYRRIYLLVGTVIMGIGLCLIPFLPNLIKDYDSLAKLGINAVLIFCLYLFQSASSYWFFAYRAAVVRADQKGYILNITQIIVTLVGNVVQILVLVLSRDFILYTVSLISFTIISNFANAIIAGKMYPEIFSKKADPITRAEAKDIFKDCGALLIYKVNGVITRAADNVILSSFVGILLVGLYSNYLLIFNTLNTLLNRFYEACKASMGNAFATSETSKSYALFETMNFLTFVLYGTAAVGIAVVSNEFIGVWLGAEYVMPQPMPILLGISIVFAGIRNNLGQVRNVTGAFRQMWFRPVLGIIINLFFSILLVQFWSVSGVLVATIIANVTTNFLVDPRIIYKHSFNNYKPVSCYYRKNMGYMLVLFTVGSLCMGICHHLQLPHPVLTLLVHIFICAVAVPGAYLLLYRKTEACQYLLHKMKGITRKFKRKTA